MKVESEEGFQPIPTYMDNEKIANYAGVFVKELYEALSVLIKKNLLEKRHNVLYVKQEMLHSF
ncbi:hypothetical protein [Listeria seeligeri]|uniref:hypothetical protein n=1 Tax=Listeria seeligeri TaxID=1640 RepID=UPI0018892FF8|nr:hypothetical protein [Listeria seeligeri]MBF2643095.1 hypothetical protein [Listeria seeligeri]